MGTTLDDVKMTLDRIEAGMGDLLNRLVIDGSHIQTTHLSDINQSMGLILAGEFRTGQGQPGYGFSGVRMAWPPMTYNADTWNVVGVNNDVLQFGLSADDGKAYFGAGAGVLDSNGLKIYSHTSGSYSAPNSISFYDGADPTRLFGYISVQQPSLEVFMDIAFGDTYDAPAYDFCSRISTTAYDGHRAQTIISSVSYDTPPDTFNFEWAGITITSFYSDTPANSFTHIEFGADQVTGFNGWQYTDDVWTYASSTSFTVSGNVAYKFPVGTKIRITQTTDKYFIVTAASYSGSTTVTVHGFGTYTIANASIVNPLYSYAKIPQGWPFGNGDWTMLTAPLTSTAWDGDAYSSTGKTLIDLSTVFGVPAGVQAVLARIIARDSGSASSTTAYFGLSPNNSSASLPVAVRPAGVTNDAYVEQLAVVPCDSSGDVYYQINATGAGTMDCWIEIWGYLGSGAQWNSVTTSTFGSSPNYAMFDTDGTLRFFGTSSIIVNDKVGINVAGGFMVKLTNNTGADTVKGTVVTNSTTTANAVVLAVDGEPDAFGVFYESGIANGAQAWVVVSGIADVYFTGSTTLGHLARTFTSGEAGYVIGQALSEAVPSAPFATDKHFCEIGHVLESRTGAGLAKVVLHFN